MIEEIAVEKLRPHPDNPRIVMREDVVESIVGSLDGQPMDPCHALIVRPVDGYYQVISGHHRLEAAKRTGLKSVPCWVRRMDAAEALLMLGTSNAQGELSPLEIGINAVDCVGRAKAGRGKRGGFREYARRLGKSQQYISQLAAAAEVYKLTSGLVNFDDEQRGKLRGCAQSLKAIKALPEACWPAAVERLLAGQCPIEQLVEDVMSWLKDKTVTAEWRREWLRDDATSLAIINGTQTASRLRHLASVADAAYAALGERSDLQEEFALWLKAFAERESWDVRAVTAQRDALVKAASTSKPTIYIGDGFEWLAKQEAADLVITDPLYSTDVDDISEYAARVVMACTSAVKPTGRVFICCGAYPHELQAYLNAPWADHVERAQVLIWSYKNTMGPRPALDFFLNYQAIVYYRGREAEPLDCPLLVEQLAAFDMPHPARTQERVYKWQKPLELGERIVKISTRPGDVVYDPFAGSGTFLVAAGNLNRAASGCELDEEVAEIAAARGCARE